MDELGVDEARTDDGKRGKVRYCARCQNHGISEELKGHKRHCPYRSCRCTNCEFTQLRQSVMVKVGHLGRHRGDVSRASPGGKRPRDAAHDDDVTVKDGAAHRQYPGVERTTNNNSNNSSSDESSSATPPSDSANVVVDVTSSSPIERLRTSTDSPALLSDNQGSTSTNGAFVPTSSFGAVSPPVTRVPVAVPAPPPKSDREGLSTISSIILGFCGNDAKKAVQCIEKAYKELVAIANPELKHTAHSAPATGLHLPRPPDVSTHLSLSGHTSSHLPLGLGSMMTLSGPDPTLMWTPPGAALAGSSLGGLVSESATSSLFVRSPLSAGVTNYPHSGLFGTDSVNAHFLKNPFIGSPALL